MTVTRLIRRLRQMGVGARALFAIGANRNLHLFELLEAARRAGLPVISLSELVDRLRFQESANRVVMLPVPSSTASGSTAEMIALAAIAATMQPKRILEFGTFDGASAWHLLANAAENCTITTIDLPSGAKVVGSSDELAQGAAGVRKYLPRESRVRLIEIDSRQWSPDVSGIDLCFIDAGHTYECVKSDTEKALSVMREGGVIVWHDAVWRHDDYGVNRYLKELRTAGMDVRLLQVGLYDYSGLAVKLP